MCRRGGEIIAEATSHIVWTRPLGTPWWSVPRYGRSGRTADGRMDPAEVRDAFRDPSRSARAHHGARRPREHPRALHGSAARRRLHGDDRAASPTSRVCRSTWTGRACSTPRSPWDTPARLLVAAAPTRSPSACPRVSPARWARWWSGRGTSSGERGVRGSCWVAGCARWACSRRPGLIALRDGPAGMIERLADDHAHARLLADGLAAIPGVSDLDPARVRTDFVRLSCRPSARRSSTAWRARAC